MYDYCVIGAGIVGLATTQEIMQRRPGAAVLAKEDRLAFIRLGTTAVSFIQASTTSLDR